MNVIISTGIVVDKPTSSGLIYNRQTVQKIIDDFNKNPNDVCGGLLNRKSIEKIGKKTHKVKSVFLHNDELMMNADIIDESIMDDLKNGQFVAKPIVINELNQPTNVKGLRRIDIERRK
jgi:hypothetical protein